MIINVGANGSDHALRLATTGDELIILAHRGQNIIYG